MVSISSVSDDYAVTVRVLSETGNCKTMLLSENNLKARRGFKDEYTVCKQM